MKLLVVLVMLSATSTKLGDVMTVRYGVYFAPSTNSKLWTLASQWLGRDCSKGSILDFPKLENLSGDELRAATKSPRRYGFHATLKAPFALNAGQGQRQLACEMEAFAARTIPVEIGKLKIKAIGRFLALVPVEQSKELVEFAGSCVSHFDQFRAPMSAEAREKRLQASMSDAQIELLDNWGYPYVMDQFRMHFTLTNALDDTVGPIVLKAASKYFASVLKDDHILDRICLYEESKAGLPFKRIADFKLLG